MMIEVKRSFFILGLLLNAIGIHGDDSVYILSKYGQTVTSTTLNWLQHAKYDSSKNVVIGSFETVPESEDPEEAHGNPSEKPKQKRPIFVCRALHSGTWVSGGQREGEKKCTVSILGDVRSFDKYELLENVDNAARLNWIHWDKYHQPQVGAVGTGSSAGYIARHVADNVEGNAEHRHSARVSHYIGYLNSHRGLGSITYVKDNGTEAAADSGELLVETEPIRYVLNKVKLNRHKKRIVKSITKVLGTATISNLGSESAKMAEAFGYSYMYSVYWGQGHAILKGLNTSITLAANKTRLPDISWGLQERENRTSVYTVEVFLEPGTGVNVTLMGNYTEMEVPYSGELISHYDDGVPRVRMINGIRRQETMEEVFPEFGPIYFLSNFSMVPTTTAPPTTTTVLPVVTSSSVLTTTMITTLKYPSNGINPVTKNTIPAGDNPSIDENLIIPPKRTDVQSDDGGPLSLQNKVGDDNNNNNSNEPQASSQSMPKAWNLLLTLLVGLSMIHRIT